MSDNEQSFILDISPSKTPEIEEKLTTKNAMSSTLNRVKSLEEHAKTLYEEAKFLRITIEEFLNE